MMVMTDSITVEIIIDWTVKSIYQPSFKGSTPFETMKCKPKLKLQKKLKKKSFKNNGRRYY